MVPAKKAASAMRLSRVVSSAGDSALRGRSHEGALPAGEGDAESGLALTPVSAAFLPFCEARMVELDVKIFPYPGRSRRSWMFLRAGDDESCLVYPRSAAPVLEAALSRP